MSRNTITNGANAPILNHLTLTMSRSYKNITHEYISDRINLTAEQIEQYEAVAERNDYASYDELIKGAYYECGCEHETIDVVEDQVATALEQARQGLI